MLFRSEHAGLGARSDSEVLDFADRGCEIRIPLALNSPGERLGVVADRAEVPEFLTGLEPEEVRIPGDLVLGVIEVRIFDDGGSVGQSIVGALKVAESVFRRPAEA